MPHLISNLYEKAYTPYTAKLAPKNLWSYPKLGKSYKTTISHEALLTLCLLDELGRKPQKTTRVGSDPRFKMFWRFIRGWITHNHKAYYTYVLLCAFGVFNFWTFTLLGYYRNRNYEVCNHHLILCNSNWLCLNWTLVLWAV